MAEPETEAQPLADGDIPKLKIHFMDLSGNALTTADLKGGVTLY